MVALGRLPGRRREGGGVCGGRGERGAGGGDVREDFEGFLYPKTDITTCVNCGLCEKICPVLNQSTTQKPLQIYAAKNQDEKIRQESSSGGIFTLLGEYVLIMEALYLEHVLITIGKSFMIMLKQYQDYLYFVVQNMYKVKLVKLF